MAFLPQSPDAEFKSYVYEQLGRIAKALSSPQRLIILNILCQGEHTVDAVARFSSLTTANVSRHLQILRSVNLVALRKDGKHVLYRLADEATSSFFVSFKEFAFTRLSELRSAVSDVSRSSSRLYQVSLEELKEKVFDDSVVILDVRPAEEYSAGHLPGAVSIPLDELDRRMGELPSDREIVAYCRGLLCIIADKAVDLLVHNGFHARRASDGIIEWQLAGGKLDRE